MESPPIETAVITGASTGIGRALACELARAGVRVGLVARNEERLRAVEEEIRAAGGTAAVAPADVADREALFSAVAALRETLGPIDLAIANAGIGQTPGPGEADLDTTERLYRVNVFGALALFAAVRPEMEARGRGHLVGIASIAGYQAFPGKGAYSGTKAALRMQLEALRAELAPRGIAVTTVNPGFIRTPLTDRNEFDMPFLMEPGPAARRIVRAIRRRRAVYDFPFRMAMVSRLLRLLPRRLYDRIARRGMGGRERTQALSGEER